MCGKQVLDTKIYNTSFKSIKLTIQILEACLSFITSEGLVVARSRGSERTQPCWPKDPPTLKSEIQPLNLQCMEI